MRVVVDTNVLISGVFFGGVPGRILDAWKEGRIRLVLSPPIVEEYRRTGEELERKYGDLRFSPVLAAVVSGSEIVDAGTLTEPVARDPEDDKFLACAVAAGVEIVVSGDLDLRSLNQWRGIRVLSPRSFADEFLSS